MARKGFLADEPADRSTVLFQGFDLNQVMAIFRFTHRLPKFVSRFAEFENRLYFIDMQPCAE
ncbi:hypothetical protein G3N58_23975 [Paraburkholderia sp. Ac-20342]|uniref:hypothetical protein n=1 Tax=Paraburkholderia sp. Ac-20342 TaxID=2703889 RepID=UPI00197E6D32|nr:hypothetical protein [Paraburkholderia sp. Ac-20342]MBN3849856.1 hypothetical protein [Paraburkholderia sp. Ac-20342]